MGHGLSLFVMLQSASSTFTLVLGICMFFVYLYQSYEFKKRMTMVRTSYLYLEKITSLLILAIIIRSFGLLWGSIDPSSLTPLLLSATGGATFICCFHLFYIVGLQSSFRDSVYQLSDKFTSCLITTAVIASITSGLSWIGIAIFGTSNSIPWIIGTISLIFHAIIYVIVTRLFVTKLFQLVLQLNPHSNKLSQIAMHNTNSNLMVLPAESPALQTPKTVSQDANAMDNNSDNNNNNNNNNNSNNTGNDNDDNCQNGTTGKATKTTTCKEKSKLEIVKQVSNHGKFPILTSINITISDDEVSIEVPAETPKLTKENSKAIEENLSKKQLMLLESITKQTLLLCIVWFCGVLLLLPVAVIRTFVDKQSVFWRTVYFIVINLTTSVLLLCVWLSFAFAQKHYHKMCNKCHILCQSLCVRLTVVKIFRKLLHES